MMAWADMLSSIGQKNSRLYEMINRTPEPRRAGRSIVLRELERERSRIARELHAGAGQPLAGIRMNLEMLKECSEELPPEGREALERLQTLAEQAFDQVRSVSHSLHPPDWQSLTTGDALRLLVTSSALPGSLDAHMDIRELPVEPDHAVKIALYRCAQECISNITRHSGADWFKLALYGRGSEVELQVEDNGRGFTQSVYSRKGIGLIALREHATALGGRCQISSGIEGTRIVIQLPVSED
jgi:signal transduction histidine kinase